MAGALRLVRKWDDDCWTFRNWNGDHHFATHESAAACGSAIVVGAGWKASAKLTRDSKDVVEFFG